jgi:hypothetical protein
MANMVAWHCAWVRAEQRVPVDGSIAECIT